MQLVAGKQVQHKQFVSHFEAHMRLVAENKYSISTFVSHARFTVFKTRELLFRHKHCGNNAPQ